MFVVWLPGHTQRKIFYDFLHDRENSIRRLIAKKYYLQHTHRQTHIYSIRRAHNNKQTKPPSYSAASKQPNRTHNIHSRSTQTNKETLKLVARWPTTSGYSLLDAPYKRIVLAFKQVAVICNNHKLNS